MNLKKILKRVIPKSVIGLYRTFQTFHLYIKCVFKADYEDIRDVKFYSDIQTVDMIIHDRKSLCRFGDGEFGWMFGEGRQYFQDQSEVLKKDLIRTFQIEDEGLLIGIPKGMAGQKLNNLQAKLYWNIVNRKYAHLLCERYQLRERTFCDASITRPYIDYKSRKDSWNRFQNIKRIWDNRNLLIVEGTGTKIGVGNDLLSNARNIRRILCPAKNAFDKITEIEEVIRQEAESGDLILVALGPTATIIAGNLYKEGLQIIDIGHIDVEYIWFLRHDKYRTPIEGKSVNESGDIGFNDDSNIDIEYRTSIVCTIS